MTEAEKKEEKRLDAEAAAAEKERLRLEKIKIQAMGKNFKGAKGGKISKNGITRMRKGGKPAVKPKKPTHRNMLEGSRPMRPLEDIFYKPFDVMKEDRQNKKSKTSAPKPKRNGGKIAKMAHGGGIELRGKTRGRIT